MAGKRGGGLMASIQPSRYGTNTVTGTVIPIEMDDSAVFKLLDHQPESIFMDSDDDPAIVYSAESYMDGIADTQRLVRPGNMITWEVQASFTMAISWGESVVPRSGIIMCEAFFTPFAPSSAFPDGIKNPLTESETYNFGHNAVALKAYIDAWKDGYTDRSVTWRNGPQEDWSAPAWLKTDRGSGNSMTVTLKVRFDTPSYRSGRSIITSHFVSPYYVKAVDVGEPEYKLGDAWEINLLEKPLLRNGTDEDSELLSEMEYRTTMSGRSGCFILNDVDLRPLDLSADISYLRDSDERTVTFTSTGDVSHSREDALDITSDEYFTAPYGGQNHSFLRISRSIYEEYGDKATASISSVRARIIT